MRDLYDVAPNSGGSHDSGGTSLKLSPVILSIAAAQVMSLSIDGKVEDALALAERGLLDGTGASPSEQAGLWYAIANV